MGNVSPIFHDIGTTRVLETAKSLFMAVAVEMTITLKRRRNVNRLALEIVRLVKRLLTDEK